MIRPIGLRYRNSIKFCIQDASHVTSENTLREFPLVIATVAKVSRKRRLWLVVRVNKKAVITSGMMQSRLSVSIWLFLLSGLI